MMHLPLPRPRRRPPWWPENEPWPPRHRPRFRFARLGCMFVLANLLIGGLFWAALAWIGRLLGLFDIPGPHIEPGWLLFSFFGFLFAIGLTAGMVSALKRMSMPMDDLLAAAERVSNGDYTTPVEVRGPAELRSLSRAFNSMLSRLHATDTHRRDLLADVSHELRTPLTILHGNLEGMLDGVYSPSEANLRSLLEETEILERLVEDLRTLALAESGALQLRREPTDLVLLLHEAAASFQPGDGQVTIQVICTDGLPQCNVDPARLRQVITNLLNNAMKHSPTGGFIELRCHLEPDHKLAIEVEDQGAGIAPADLPYVFDRFYKSSESTGMGLGLSIARYLVEAHGGKIEAFSPPGKGALVRLELDCGG